VASRRSCREALDDVVAAHAERLGACRAVRHAAADARAAMRERNAGDTAANSGEIRSSEGVIMRDA
jgi:hypothetical protein